MSITRLIVTALLAVTSPCLAQPQDGANPMLRSATKARDVGGFGLGMQLGEAAKLARVENIGNGGYQATKDGIRYDLGVTRLGRIYRVESEQELGRFTIDDAFLNRLRAKLTAKYGPPATSIGETFGWSLVEPVKRTGNQALPFETNWASAYVDSDSEGVTLHVKLLDFRIMWQDEAQLNREPRNKASKEIAL